jgi:imidazolonepropionase
MDSEIKMLEAINELNAEEVTTVVPTFLGAHAVPPEFAGNREEYVRLITEKLVPYVGAKKLARFCDVFCERGYFDLGETNAILSTARQHGLVPKIHAEQLSPTRSAELAGALEAVSADHLEHIDAKGIEVMAERGVVATLLPGVSFFLSQPHAPARQLIDGGVPVALATDFNPGSCMSYSMPLMMTIACAQMHMTPEEAITASTLNAAAALNLSAETGSIETGKKADIIVLEIPNYKFLPYHFGENHVTRVVKDGVVLEI